MNGLSSLTATNLDSTEWALEELREMRGLATAEQNVVIHTAAVLGRPAERCRGIGLDLRHADRS
jgi:hypothetical protein